MTKIFKIFKEWQTVWERQNRENAERFSSESARIRDDLAKIQVAQAEKQIQTPPPQIIVNTVKAEEPVEPEEQVDVDSILKENFAQHPNEGLAPDYHDKSMEKVEEPLKVEDAGAVSSPMVVAYGLKIFNKKI